MTVGVATDNIRGAIVDIPIRRGVNTMMVEVNTVGRHGNEWAFYTFKVRVFRAPNGTIGGHQIMTGDAVPSWSVAPVLDTTLSGVRLTVGPDTATWRSTIRYDLITTL